MALVVVGKSVPPPTKLIRRGALARIVSAVMGPQVWAGCRPRDQPRRSARSGVRLRPRTGRRGGAAARSGHPTRRSAPRSSAPTRDRSAGCRRPSRTRGRAPPPPRRWGRTCPGRSRSRPLGPARCPGDGSGESFQVDPSDAILVTLNSLRPRRVAQATRRGPVRAGHGCTVRVRTRTVLKSQSPRSNGGPRSGSPGVPGDAAVGRELPVPCVPTDTDDPREAGAGLHAGDGPHVRPVRTDRRAGPERGLGRHPEHHPRRMSEVPHPCNRLLAQVAALGPIDHRLHVESRPRRAANPGPGRPGSGPDRGGSATTPGPPGRP